MTNPKKIFILSKELERNEKAIKDMRRLRVSNDLKNAYKRLIEEQSKELIQAKIAAEKEINEIPDETARLIAKMRYIDLKSWSEIGKELHYDATWAYRLLKKHTNGGISDEKE